MARLAIIVPISVLLIFILLFDAFGSFKSAALILLNIPFALVGGIFALLFTGIHLSVSAAVATAVVRLTDVAPDGTSSQVSAGILNLTHRSSHERPAPMEPGRIAEIRVSMRPAGYRFLAGHRLRVSVASAAWPIIWRISNRPSRSISPSPTRRTPPAASVSHRRLPKSCSGWGSTS